MDKKQFAEEIADELVVGFDMEVGRISTTSRNVIIEITGGNNRGSLEDMVRSVVDDLALYFGVPLVFCGIIIDLMSMTIVEVVLEF